MLRLQSEPKKLGKTSVGLGRVVNELFDLGEQAFAERGISTAAAAAAADVPVTTVRTWVNRGTATPTYRPDKPRQGAPYYWTAIDVVGLRALHHLRQRGCPTVSLRTAWRLVQDWGVQGCVEAQLLVWKEGEPQLMNPSELDALLSIRTAPVAVIAIPLHEWLADGSNAPTVEFDLREARIRSASLVTVHDTTIGIAVDDLRDEILGLFGTDTIHRS
jgi:DNA-binding transcriptional MerR regulator